MSPPSSGKHVALPRIDPSWALFLDRDGVLNVKISGGYVLTPSMLDILPGVPQALSLLAGRFGPIVVVTNQRGVGRGLMSLQDLARVNDELLARIAPAGGRIDAIFTCPHDFADRCSCRKPKVGLALHARERFPQIDFRKSVLVGDSDSDIEMGKALGIYTVRITQQEAGDGSAFACASLLDFARHLS